MCWHQTEALCARRRSGQELNPRPRPTHESDDLHHEPNRTKHTLRKSDDEDEINGEEAQQIGVYHTVDHNDEWSDLAGSTETTHFEAAVIIIV